MDWKTALFIAGEIIIPLLLALLARNTELTKNNLSEIKAFKKAYFEDIKSSVQWKTEIVEAVKQNTSLSERNARLVEGIITSKLINNEKETK